MSKEKRYKDYVCPNCLKMITKCRCKFEPNHLIQIDNELQNIIIKLNEKGYKTFACCCGHWEDKIPNTYIAMFNMPNTTPIGFQREKDAVRYIYKKENYKNKSEFINDRNNMIKNLSDWVNEI